MNFETFDLHPAVMAGIHAMRYTTPTPIQSQALPPALAGRDVIALAGPGAGKTAAFALPVLQRLRSRSREGIRALVISPEREMAERTSEVITRLGARTGLATQTICEGVTIPKQLRALRYGPAIIVACPDRLETHLWKGSIKLTALEVLVIDEADRLVDMGFLPSLRNILDYVEHRHQTLLFSAAIPVGVRRLARDFLHDPVTVRADAAVPVEPASPAASPRERHVKTELLQKLLDGSAADSVLVFARTRRRAEKLARQLVKSGYHVSALQGNVSRDPRRDNGFEDGTIKVLVVTGSAWGIDVRSISHVVNRVVREADDGSGRRIGGTGRTERTADAMTFVTEAGEARVRELEKMLEGPLEPLSLSGFDHGKPAPGK